MHKIAVEKRIAKLKKAKKDLFGDIDKEVDEYGDFELLNPIKDAIEHCEEALLRASLADALALMLPSNADVSLLGTFEIQILLRATENSFSIETYNEEQALFLLNLLRCSQSIPKVSIVDRQLEGL